jgi:hypothetical protein
VRIGDNSRVYLSGQIAPLIRVTTRWYGFEYQVKRVLIISPWCVAAGGGLNGSWCEDSPIFYLTISQFWAKVTEIMASYFTSSPNSASRRLVIEAAAWLRGREMDGGQDARQSASIF